MEERRKLEKELSDARKQLALGGGASGASDNEVETINGISLIAKVVHGVSPKDLKPLADAGKTKIGSGVVVFIGISEEDNKASAVVGVTDDLTQRFNAVELVKVLSEALGGKGGGGRPDMAQAGGPDGSKAEEALEHLRAKLK